MDFLLYFFGPILAFGLPLLLLVASAIWGIRATGNRAKIVAMPLVLLGLAALVVPANARFSATNQWPAPWWLAAYFGAFKYEWVYWIVIAAAATGVFYVVVCIRVGVALLSARFHRAASGSRPKSGR